MVLGSLNSTSSPASTLVNVIMQLQALTQVVATNSRVDLLAGQFQQLSNDVPSLPAPPQSASTVHPQTSRLLEVPLHNLAPNIPSKALPLMFGRLPPSILPQISNII